MPTEPITSRRLSLVALDAPTLALMEAGDAIASFRWPDWWPDDVDREHLAVWRRRAAESDEMNVWGPRAVVNAQAQMVGHAGFHLPPRPWRAHSLTRIGRCRTNEGAVELVYRLDY